MLKPADIDELAIKFKEIVRENNLDGVVLADVEGLPIVSYLQGEESNEDTLAAAGAAIFTASLMTVADAGKRGVEQVIIDSPDGYIVYTQLTEDLVLGLIAPRGAKLGIIRMIIKDTQNFIKKIGDKK